MSEQLNQMDMSGDQSPANLLVDYTEDRQQQRLYRKLTYIWAVFVATSFFILVLWIGCRVSSHFFQNSIVEVPNGPHQIECVKRVVVNKSNSSETPVNCPSAHHHKDEVPLFTQLLIMMGLLSAVGTTMGIAVIRFSFKSDSQDERKAGPALPLVESISELVKEIAAAIRSKT